MAFIDPVDPLPKLPVLHWFPLVGLSLYIQEHPLEEVGKLEYLPVPSSHELDIGNTSIEWFVAKFLCSVENNCKLEVKLLDVKLIASRILLFENWINYEK